MNMWICVWICRGAYHSKKFVHLWKNLEISQNWLKIWVTFLGYFPDMGHVFCKNIFYWFWEILVLETGVIRKFKFKFKPSFSDTLLLFGTFMIQSFLLPFNNRNWANFWTSMAVAVAICLSVILSILYFKEINFLGRKSAKFFLTTICKTAKINPRENLSL